VPKAKGNEAMEAALVNPYKPLSRYGIQIPKSVSKAMVRLTPLPGGEVEVALQAHDESAEQAKKTAIEVSQAINALADLSAGVSSFLELAGLGRTVRLPRIELEARGQEIWGRQVLTAEQVNFLLAQLERQAAMWKQAAARHAPQKPAHPPADGRLRDAKKPAPKKMKLPAPPRGGVRPAP
jgi:hypothetical protein